VFGLRGEGVKAEISLVCMTLSNALESSIDMVTVRWGLQLVKASCDLVGDGAEGSGGGPIGTESMLSEATGRWLLSSGRRKRSRTLAAGQRREMGR